LVDTTGFEPAKYGYRGITPGRITIGNARQLTPFARAATCICNLARETA